jgi:hypothetical protein
MIRITYPIYETHLDRIYVNPHNNQKVISCERSYINLRSTLIYSAIICHKFEYTFVFGGVYKMYPNKLFHVNINYG